jgi:hypothetical protein
MSPAEIAEWHRRADAETDAADRAGLSAYGPDEDQWERWAGDWDLTD